eukprot:4864967-Prymnesium_polylepis.2
MSAREPFPSGARPPGGGLIPPSGTIRPGDLISPAPTATRPSNRTERPRSAGQHDLSSIMLRGFQPRNMAYVSDALMASLTATIRGLS